MPNEDYWENEEGVHHIGPFNREMMLCGDACDGEGQSSYVNPEHDGSDFGAMHPTRKRVITCPRCLAMIAHCKAIRVKEFAILSIVCERGVKNV